MDSRRARLIAEVISHLEDLDGQGLKGQMEPEKGAMMMIEGSPKEEAMESPEEEAKEGPDMMVKEHGTDPKSDEQDQELTDEDLEELAKLGG